MSILYLSIMLCVGITGIGCNFHVQAQDSIPISIGDQQLYIKKENYTCHENFTYYIQLHENEHNAIAACREILKEYDGIIFSLHHLGTRNVSFTYNSKRYTFDPNRMFSAAGRRQTLTHLSEYSLSADSIVKHLADTIINMLKPAKLVVALHNNTDGVPLTMHNFVDTNQYKTYFAPDADVDDFLLTTDVLLFEMLSNKNYNVVLELPHAMDDGSLSAYFTKSHIAYVNVEAEFCHEAKQMEMLKAVAEIAEERNTIR